MASAADGDTLLRIVVIVLVVVLLAPLLMMAFAIPMMGTMGGRPMGGSSTLWGLGMMLLWLVVLLGIGYVIYRAFTGRGSRETDPAMEELRMAYARGDLTEEEFEERRRNLRQQE